MKTERYYQTFLRSELAKRINANSRYSLRAFARYLGLDPSVLSRVLNGQKRLSPASSEKIIKKLDISPEEANNILHSMASAYQEDGVKRTQPKVKELLKGTSRKNPERDLTPEIFRIISDWYHYAILQLREESDFKNDNAWIARQLNISEIEAKLAIERMLKLELITDENGVLKRSSENLTAGDSGITSSAHRKRIKQITEKSIHSLENDDIKIRNHTTMTMAIDPELMPLAKEMIQDFMDQLSEKLQSKKKQVYELQINLFPIQRNNS